MRAHLFLCVWLENMLTARTACLPIHPVQWSPKNCLIRSDNLIIFVPAFFIWVSCPVSVIEFGELGTVPGYVLRFE